MPAAKAIAGLSAAPVNEVAQVWEDQLRPPSMERLTATAPCAGVRATKAK